MAAPLRRRVLHRFITSVTARVRTKENHSVCVRGYMTPNRNILRLNERGLIQTIFPEEKSPDLYKALKSGRPQTFYCGFDPTADSLHIGNLLAVMALLHCHRAGHNIIALLGGATAQIGDPSGKSKEREAMPVDTVLDNSSSIEASLHRIFANYLKNFTTNCNDLTEIRIMNNTEWYMKRNVIEFLSKVGRHFRMSSMLSKQSVQTRLNSAEGMSLTEFTYQMFQSYDWLYLFQKHDCSIQIGGNDQLGNMVAGYELIGRVTKKPVFGLTVPLVTTLTGDKLGKTAGNAVWLNSDKTSPFELYQFYINLPDSELKKYLQLFTFYSDSDIEDIMIKNLRKPEERHAHKTIAENVVKLVHGEEGFQSALRCTEVLFRSSAEDLARMSEKELIELFRNTPVTEMIMEAGTTVMDAVMKAGCFNTEVDAERIIRDGGIYVNLRRSTNPEAVLSPGEHILPNSTTLIRKGKKNYYIIKWHGTGVL